MEKEQKQYILFIATILLVAIAFVAFIFAKMAGTEPEQADVDRVTTTPATTTNPASANQSIYTYPAPYTYPTPYTYPAPYPYPAPYVYPTPNTSQPRACTMEAKLCPDGSYVGRTGPNCEFSPCPDY